MEQLSFNTKFTSSNDKFSTRTAIIEERTESDITMSHASVDLLILGAALSVKQPFAASAKEILIPLSHLILAKKDHEQEETVTLTVDKNTVSSLRSFVEAYLNDQEAQRANLLPSFNADTYILGKMLLIDIREWQTGIWVEVVQTHSPVTPERD